MNHSKKVVSVFEMMLKRLGLLMPRLASRRQGLEEMINAIKSRWKGAYDRILKSPSIAGDLTLEKKQFAVE